MGLLQTQHQNVSSNGSSTNITVTATTLGSLIIVAVTTSGTTTLSSITDNAGSPQTYTPIYQNYNFSGTFYQSFYYFPNTQAGVTSITLHFTGTGNAVTSVMREYSGISASPLDQNNENLGTSGSPSSNSVTTNASYPNQLLIGCIANDGAHTLTGGSGWSNAITESSGAAVAISFEDQIISSSGSYTATGTISTSGSHDWGAMIATFILSSTVPTTSTTFATPAAPNQPMPVVNPMSFMVAYSSLNSTFAFSQTLNAALSFTGAMNKQINYPITAGLSFAGVLNRLILFGFVATLSFAGSLAKRIARSPAATLSFSGGLSRQIIRTLTTATLSFSGTLAKKINVALNGVLSFSGAITRVINRSLAATLSFSGNIAKTTLKILNGLMSYTLNPSNGYALMFDGVSNYVEVPNETAFSPSTTGSLTVSVWMRPNVNDFVVSSHDSSNGDYVNWLGKSQFGSPNTEEWEFRMYSKTNSTRPNRISFYIFNPTGGIGVGSYFQDTVYPGEWINVIGVLDGTNVVIYKNGTQRQSNVYSGTITPAATSANLRWGHVEDSSQNGFFGGAMSQLIIWNRALSSTEITNTSNGNPPSSGIVGQWNMTDGSGTTVADSSGNAYNGTLKSTGSNVPMWFATGDTLTMLITKTLSAALSFSGSISRQIYYAFTASLSFSGFIAKRIYSSLSGALSFNGSLTRRIGRIFNPALSFTGILSIFGANSALLTAALSFSVNSTRAVNRSFIATLSFTGSLTKRILKTMVASSLSFAGYMTRQLLRSFSASLGFVGRLLNYHHNINRGSRLRINNQNPTDIYLDTSDNRINIKSDDDTINL